MSSLRIGLIGAGNLAWNLAAALEASPHQIVQVFSRHRASADKIAAEFTGISACTSAEELDPSLDLVIIASSDHGISDIAAAYSPFVGKKSIFAHTSGSIGLDALKPLGENIGVFYPMQTFTKGHRAIFSEVPIFLEGNEAVVAVLQQLAAYLSPKVREMNSESRLRLHLGAVFASNFANFMWLLADDTAKDAGENGLSAYAPLIKECFEKAMRYGPFEAQTGPARRGDQVTMRKHFELIKAQDPIRAELYEHLSEMIEKRFGIEES